MAAAGEDEIMTGEEAAVDPDSPEEQAKRAGRMQELMQSVFEAGLPTEAGVDKAELQSRILAELRGQNMGPLYDIVAGKLGWASDPSLREQMRTANEAEIKKLDAAIADARETHGDVEVAEAITKKAAYFATIGDKDAALRTYAEVPEKALSTGQKIDIAMAAIRLGFLHGDLKLIKARLAVAKELNEKGGDWDRRNRLKVYEGAYSIMVRDLPKAAEMLLDSIATFTAVELLSYKHFICYTVLVCLKVLDRPKLKKKVIDSPDVLSVIHDIPHLSELLNSFYECRYDTFMRSLTALYPALARDRLFHAAAPYYLREMRLAAYTQFLESYKSVTLAGMSRAFGLPAAFMDSELSRFISAGRINAKIDALAGVIETTRPDTKNGQYLAVIKQGDGLLNKIQKLSRVVAV